MLDSVAGFDISVRVRELELSVTRRLRESLRPYIADPVMLERAMRDTLVVARDFAGSFQAVSDRARFREERALE